MNFQYGGYRPHMPPCHAGGRDGRESLSRLRLGYQKHHRLGVQSSVLKVRRHLATDWAPHVHIDRLISLLYV